MGKHLRNVGLLPLIIVSLSACTEVAPEGSFFGSLFGNNAVLSGMPASYNNSSSINLGVSGDDIEAYRHKWGDMGTTDCADPTGYVPADPAEDLVAVPLNLTPGADGDYRVCVIGRDSEGEWQDYAEATQWTWTRDTQAPTVTAFVANGGQPDPTNGTTIEFLISFDEPMDFASFENSDFTTSPGGGFTDVNSITQVDSQNFVVSIDVLSTPASIFVASSLSASMVTDLAGNVSAGFGSTNVTHDSTPPGVGIFSPASGISINNPSSIGINGFCEDGIGNVTVTGPVSGSPLSLTCSTSTFSDVVTYTGADGDKILTITQTDLVGNVGTGTHTVTLDTTDPVVTVDSHTDFELINTDPALLTGDCEDGLVLTIAGAGLNSTVNGSCTGGRYSELVTFSTGDSMKSFTVSQTDVAGNFGSLGFNLDLDTTDPFVNMVTAAAGDYIMGNTVTVEVHFSENITFNAAPLYIDLETGTTDYQATYTGTTGTVAYFDFTVPADAYNPDLDYVSSTSLSVSGGSLRDAAGNIADLNLPFPGTSMSISEGFSDANDVNVVGTPALLSITPMSTNDFGQVEIGFTGSTLTFMVDNLGNAPANFVTPSTTSSFSIDGSTCSVTISPGSSCTIDVDFNPMFGGNVSGESLDITYDDGISPSEMVSQTLLGEGMFVVDPVYASLADWNDYVSNDGGRYASSGSECTGGEAGNYLEACYHAGEIRRVEVPGYSVCGSLNLVEANDNFDWECSDLSGTATFYTTGLQPGKGLRDLINASAGGSWINNTVNIYDGATPLGSSLNTVWWGNAISALPTDASPNVVSLATEGMLYFHDSNIQNWGYNILADKVSIVSLGNATIERNAGDPAAYNCNSNSGNTATPDMRAVICSGNTRFLWVEASINGESAASVNHAESAITFVGVDQSVIFNTSIHNLDHATNRYALRLRTSDKNIIHNLDISGASGGIQIDLSADNIIKGANIADVGASNMAGVYITGGGSNGNHLHKVNIAKVIGTAGSGYGLRVTSPDNVFEKININNVRSATASNGIALTTGADDNYFSEIFVSGIEGRGIWMNNSVGTSMHRMTVASTSGPGIFIQGNPVDNMFHHSIFVNGNDGIYATPGGGINNRFYNTVSAHNSGAPFDGSGPGGIFDFEGFLQLETGFGSCATGMSNLGSGCNDAGITRITQDVDSGAFVGALVADDPVNPVASFVEMLASIMGVDAWLSFAEPFRAWGDGSAPFLDSGMAGFSLPSTMQIYDYGVLNAGDLHQTSFDGQSLNGFTYGSVVACPAGLNGNDTLSEPKNGNPFLVNAFEISFDGVGNDNTLCESGENCIYGANKGGFQGKGDYYTEACAFTSGTISDANIYAYPQSSN